MNTLSSFDQKTIVYIDGFNLYYGLRARKWYKYLWLNLFDLAKRVCPPESSLEAVKYFTSWNSHPPDKYARQKTFITALQAVSPIEIVWGKYSRRPYNFPDTGCVHKIPKEKFTDVNIAINMVNDAYLGRSTNIVLVGGDIDQVPTLTLIRERFPEKYIRVVFPPERPSDNLKHLAHNSFMMSEDILRRSLLPNPVRKKNGTTIYRPNTWTV